MVDQEPEVYWKRMFGRHHNPHFARIYAFLIWLTDTTSFEWLTFIKYQVKHLQFGVKILEQFFFSIIC